MPLNYTLPGKPPKKIKTARSANKQAMSDYEKGQQRKKERLKSFTEYDDIQVKKAVERNIDTPGAIKKGAKLNRENLQDVKTSGGNPGFIGEQEDAPIKEKRKPTSIFPKKPVPKFMVKKR
jgi:hypothetical protein